MHTHTHAAIDRPSPLHCFPRVLPPPPSSIKRLPGRPTRARGQGGPKRTDDRVSKLVSILWAFRSELKKNQSQRPVRWLTIHQPPQPFDFFILQLVGPRFPLARIEHRNHKRPEENPPSLFKITRKPLGGRRSLLRPTDTAATLNPQLKHCSPMKFTSVYLTTLEFTDDQLI